MRILILLVLLAQALTFAYYVKVPPKVNNSIDVVEDMGCSGWIEASTIAATYKYENL